MNENETKLIETVPTDQPSEQELTKRRNKFITALRSGEYKQGQGALYNYNDDGFCCIGVGCAVANWGPIIRISKNRYDRYDDSFGYDFFAAYYGAGFLSDPSHTALTETLVIMNDGEPFEESQPTPFPEIADFLERFWDLG